MTDPSGPTTRPAGAEQPRAGADPRPIDPKDWPGIRGIVVGTVIAVLAPLFGFLAGSTLGMPEDGTSVDLLFLWLMGGLVVGGVGVLIALAGARKLIRARRRARQVDEGTLPSRPA